MEIAVLYLHQSHYATGSNKFYLNLVNSTNRGKMCDATVISPSGAVSEKNSGKVRDLDVTLVITNILQPAVSFTLFLSYVKVLAIW